MLGILSERCAFAANLLPSHPPWRTGVCIRASKSERSGRLGEMLPDDRNAIREAVKTVMRAIAGQSLREVGVSLESLAAIRDGARGWRVKG